MYEGEPIHDLTDMMPVSDDREGKQPAPEFEPERQTVSAQSIKMVEDTHSGLAVYHLDSGDWKILRFVTAFDGPAKELTYQEAIGRFKGQPVQIELDRLDMNTSTYHFYRARFI